MCVTDRNRRVDSGTLKCKSFLVNKIQLQFYGIQLFQLCNLIKSCMEGLCQVKFVGIDIMGVRYAVLRFDGKTFVW